MGWRRTCGGLALAGFASTSGLLLACSVIIGDRATAIVADLEAGTPETGTDDGETDGPPDADAGAGPSSIAASHLQLWLTADSGLLCTGGRVQLWADRSPNHRDAEARFGQLQPQCGVHQLAGVDVPYFSAPKSTSTPNIIDETLDVDLSFLAGNYYTVFVVERRWTDYPNGDPKRGNFFLGTTPIDQTPAATSCGTNNNFALQFGYVYYDGWPSYGIDQGCNGIGARVPTVPSPPPAQASVDTGRYQLNEHTVWQNGTVIAQDNVGHALYEASGGAVGRALYSQFTDAGFDDRFQGDIAEVVVYDAALSEADRLAVESYLRGHWSL